MTRQYLYPFEVVEARDGSAYMKISLDPGEHTKELRCCSCGQKWPQICRCPETQAEIELLEKNRIPQCPSVHLERKSMRDFFAFMGDENVGLGAWRFWEDITRPKGESPCVRYLITYLRVIRSGMLRINFSQLAKNLDRDEVALWSLIRYAERQGFVVVRGDLEGTIHDVVVTEAGEALPPWTRDV